MFELLITCICSNSSIDHDLSLFIVKELFFTKDPIVKMLTSLNSGQKKQKIS